MTVIAMTREMGSRGKDVSLQLAKQLGLEIVHHQVAEQRLAEKLNLRESAVHRYLEGHVGLLDRWRIDKKRLAYYTFEEVFELAEKGNVLIRGWGATQLLRKIPHVICLRVCASMQSRVATMMKRLDINRAAVALKEIQANDAAHARIMKDTFGIDWQDPVHYDLVLNTDRLSIDACVDIIIQMVKSQAFEETSASRAQLAEMKRLAGIRPASRLELLEQAAKLKAAINPGAASHARLRHDERPMTREDRDVRF